jgi:hypothetical protein
MRRTKRQEAIFLAAAFALAAAAGGGAEAPSKDAAKKAAAAPASEGFSVDGSGYVAVAEATGGTASEAQEKARGAALGILFRGLGKDRLFAEIFVSSPPVGLVLDLLSSKAEAGKVRARVSIRVDDESIRIIERGPYMAAAIGLLDKAEKAASEAEDRAGRGTAAESGARLGEALVSYATASDAARSGLSLIEGIEDASIFSSAGKRTAPDLRRALQVSRDSASAGIERVRSAQAALAADETGKAIGESVKRAEAAADHADALLSGSEDILSDPSAVEPERLSPLRDKLVVERRSIADSQADVGRAKAALPKGNDYLRDEIEFAVRRLGTVDSALSKAYRSVDREIRDPAPRRAARARAIRWAFLHSPSERLSARIYLPLGITPSEDEVFAKAPFDFSLGAEGAFPFGSGGIWARTRTFSATTSVSEEEDEEEYAVSQSFDLGFWRKNLFFAGFTWDWYRGYGDERLARPGRLELGIGGLSEHGREETLYKADWLLALHYELPYETDDFILLNVLNAGLETQLRLGDFGLIEAEISSCLHKDADDLNYSEVLSYAFGFGLRVPAPFLLGGEYAGTAAWPIVDGKCGDRIPGSGGSLRLYVGYSL